MLEIDTFCLTRENCDVEVTVQLPSLAGGASPLPRFNPKSEYKIRWF